MAELEEYASLPPVRLEVELLVGQAIDFGRDQREERDVLTEALVAGRVFVYLKFRPLLPPDSVGEPQAARRYSTAGHRA